MENQINRDCKFSYLAGIETANFMLKCNADLLGAVQTAMVEESDRENTYSNALYAIQRTLSSIYDDIQKCVEAGLREGAVQA